MVVGSLKPEVSEVGNMQQNQPLESSTSTPKEMIQNTAKNHQSTFHVQAVAYAQLPINHF